MNPDNFSSNLKEIMDILGMNQSDLCSRCGIDQATVSNLVAGKFNPSLETICKILKVIPVSFERLVK